MLQTSRYTKRDTESASPPAVARMENDYANENDDDNYSEVSSSIAPNGSVVSTVPDKHGFYGGAQYLSESKHLISPKTVKERERKWLRMTANWDNQIFKNFKKVQNRCRKGIPQSIRPRAWLYLTGANKLLEKKQNYYFELCNQPGDRKWIEDIRKDLHRQFPYHEMFQPNGPGQEELFNVLKAYTIYNPTVGYCQAQAPIAAFLLMHMPAEQAFWCFVSICDTYVSDYYCEGMETLIQDGNILFALLKEREPHMHKLLRKQSIDPIMYMTEWFLCAFTRTLPWPTLLRFWDIFLVDGVKTLFKMGLIVIKISLQEKSYSGLKKRFPTMCETLEALRNPPLHLLDEERIIKKLIQLEISEETFQYYHTQQIMLRRKPKEVNKIRETDIL